MKTAQFKHLFSPITVGAMTLKNRIVVPGHATLLMPLDGMPTERILRYWLSKAKGGAALIITHIHNVMPYQGNGPQTALQTEEGIDAYMKIADELHKNDVKFLLQISHMGGSTNSQLHGGGIIGPSAGPSKVVSKLLPSGVETVHEMDTDEINAVVTAFRETAASASKAGFDGCAVCI